MVIIIRYCPEPAQFRSREVKKDLGQAAKALNALNRLTAPI